VYVKLALILALLAWLVPACVAEPNADAPVVSVPQTPVPPTLDGRVEAREWAHAAVLSDFVAVGDTRLPALRTQVYVMYDATNLYLGAICYDPTGQFRTEVTQRDGPVLTDDSLEVFIDTVGERKYGETAHLAVNAAGIQYDALGDDATQDFKWTSVTARGADFWSVEIALPFARGIGPKVGDSWLINVGRHVARTGEVSSWCPVSRGVGEMDKLGTLLFSGPPYRVVLADLGNLWLGDNTAHFEVQYLGGSPGPGAASFEKLNTRVDGRSTADRFFNSVRLHVTDRTLAAESPYRVSSEHSTVVFSLSDSQGETAWRSAPYPITAPLVTGGLSGLESALSGALLAWSALPEGPHKAELWDNLSELLTAWQSLSAQAARRDSLPPAEYAGLLTQANQLQTAAESLKAEAAG
jgi:hypothetical protein